jgi:hypothetical protein
LYLATQGVRMILAVLALCAWHDAASARIARSHQRPLTILCLGRADARWLRHDENDLKDLDCLLRTVNGEAEDWRAELRRCLSASGAIRVAECEY